MIAKQTVLLVIDLQNDFCLKDSVYNRIGYPIEQNQKIAKRINSLIDKLKIRGIKIYYLLSNYDRYLIHGKKCNFCLKGSKGALSFLSKNKADKIIIKTTHDGFYKNSLERNLKKDQIKNILLAGISTSVCVDSTARAAVYRGFNATILSDGVVSRDKKMHKFALKNFSKNFGNVISISGALNNLK